MKPIRLLVGLWLVLVVAACGGNSETGSSPGASSSPAAAGAASPSSSVVPYEKLAALFPTIPGYTRDADPKGETDTSSNVARAQADYTQEGGTSQLSVEMMDVSSNTTMLAPLRESLRTQGTKTIVAGTQKASTVAGFPASEEWTPSAGNGVVSVLVADRFVVSITGSSIGSVSAIYKAFDAIDLKKVAALK